MARDRKGAQLALELEPQLMQRLRARAAADGRPVAVLVRRWIEAGLGGALEQQATAAAPAAGPELLARVEALEAAVSDLHRPASPERVSLQAQPGEPLPLPERRLTPAEAAGLLTTPEVGKALGLSSDSALTNWIAREARKRDGSAVGGIYRGHRLRGKALLPGGQKPGWLWEPA
jgi:hypothetical protein